MAVKTVCDVCNTVVSKVGKDYATVPVVYYSEPDLHTGRSEKERRWEDICVPCFERTYARYPVIPLSKEEWPNA